jgi:hypothetical protein
VRLRLIDEDEKCGILGCFAGVFHISQENTLISFICFYQSLAECERRNLITKNQEKTT